MAIPDPAPSLLDWLRFHLVFLARPDLGDATLENGRSPAWVLAHPDEVLAALPEAPPSLGPALRQGRSRAAALVELDRCRRQNVAILRRGEPAWPANLRGVPCAPAVIFARGSLLPRDGAAVAMVGSRRPSPHGLRQAERFAGELARHGVTVVSGLARGIDAAAHRSALEAGGRTIAVLGSGLGRIYPREHEELAGEISRAGAVVTEFPWDAPPRRFHFPHRNRILSALSLAVLVVEAGEKSGSLITAEWAADQDRPVLALPGRADALEARGGLRLIQAGAHLVLEPEEVLDLLGGSSAAARLPAGVWPPPPAAGPTLAAAGPLPRPRGDGPEMSCPGLAALFEEEDSWHADRIVERLGRPPGEVLAELSRLEIEGLLVRLPGGAYARR